VAKVLVKAVLSGEEETKYAKWFVDRLNTHRRWRKLSGEVDQNIRAH
jgi:hypothetical protein